MLARQGLISDSEAAFDPQWIEIIGYEIEKGIHES